MKALLTIVGLALASTVVSSPANAQKAELARKANVSNEAKKPIVELQAAVTAKDTANIPAKLAAAQAVAKSPDEKLIVAKLQLTAAVDANDQAGQAAAIEALIASGGIDQAQLPTFYLALGKIQNKGGKYAQAAATFERILAIDPANSDALVWLAESRNSQGQVKEAVAILQRAWQAKAAAGQKADEAWYKRAVALSLNAKLPGSTDISRQWLTAYPTTQNWRDAIGIYRNANSSDPVATLDALRLARAVGILRGDSDFLTFAQLANTATPGEARSVFEEASAAQQLDLTKPAIRDAMKILQANKVMSADELPQLATEARAAATARLALRTGDAFYGYGDYAKAADLYRVALTKTGADASLINLRLGMALARSGDKAGATAALNAVAGPRSELAKYWLVYLATHA